MPIVRQCRLLSINRSTYYYKPQGESEENLTLMRHIDELHLKYPFKGSRRLVDALWDEHGIHVNRKRVQRLMGLLGLTALYPKKKTTTPDSAHRVYPYLLRDLVISCPNQVWCTDITYIPMAKGFVYLVAIMDWYSRKVLSWQLSNTMDVDFCLEALDEAIQQYGTPEIFNSDQGSQFTSDAFTGKLLDKGIRISMDGKGRWVDNVFIERLWRSLKYEEIYLKAYQDVPEARECIGEWLSFYNGKRRHSALDRKTPNQVYLGMPSGLPEAA